MVMCLILNVSLKEKAGPLVAVYGGLSAIYHSFVITLSWWLRKSGLGTAEA